MNYILIGILGSAAGIFSGMFGLGGAILIVPALVYLFGFNQYMAQGTSLAMLLPPIGLLATYKYWQAGNVNIKVAIILAVTFFISAAIGAHISLNIPEALLKRIFGGALVVVGIFMLSGK